MNSSMKRNMIMTNVSLSTIILMIAVYPLLAPLLRLVFVGLFATALARINQVVLRWV